MNQSPGNTAPNWNAPLHKADPALKTLFSGYLITVGLGLLMSFAQIMFTHGMADGKFGLSVTDIVYSYYGNREGSKLEAKLQGSMKLFASEEVKAELIKWARDGSPRAEWDSRVSRLVGENCVRCHSVVPGIPDYTSYDGMRTVTQIDEGATIPTLARVSHIHLFGIAFIFFFICLIFSMTTGGPHLLKITAIAAPYAFLVLDVFSWWATKYVPQAAYLTIVGGFGYSMASAYMILTSLWQMWFKRA
jgi:hypothetical protein